VLKRRQAGVSLIELMIGLLIVGFLLMLGVPAFNTFLQNTQIRNAAETTLSGLALARAEAVRRNAAVRFQLVSDLTASCTISDAALANSNNVSWVVSLADPEGLCNVEPSEVDAPRIVQKKDAREGTRNILVSTLGAPVITFTGLGRVTGAAMTRINFSNPAGVCEHVDASGQMRCLAILITSGGAAKLCDPAVGDNTDPRHCS